MVDIESQVQAVNQLLLDGEPGNISVDEHSDYTGYKPQHIIDAMNKGFGIGNWGFEEVLSEIVPGEKGGLVLAQVKVWLKSVEFQPTAWGQNRVTRGDVGDARKGTQTDALKKALSYFSIGNRAYHGLLAKPKSGQPRQQQNQQRQPVAARPAAQQAVRQGVDLAAIERVRVFVSRTFNFADGEITARWEKYKQHVLGRIVADAALSPGDLGTLRAYADGEARKHGENAAPAKDAA
jgi:hypothetical protein